jgi:RHS repeat-associated protein
MENKLVKDSPLTTHADYTYQEDGVGNITQINDAVNATFNRAFSYDDLNRLTTANTQATPLWGNGTYNYDAMGNVTSLALGTVRTASFAYVGTTPKLSSVTENNVSRPVSYDPTGNETQVGTGLFAYSARSFFSSGDGLTYTYDGRGLRTMVVNSDVTPAKRYFFYSPEMNLLAESELTTLAAPVILYDYVWFNGHPVGQVNGGTQWTFTDHLGTPLIQTDTLANVFWRAEHEPYGRVFTLRTANQHQPLRLPGQESEELNISADGDGASERFYNIFRWYRYGWDRYTQPDPLSLQSGINLFAYSKGSPTNYSDPSGLACKSGRCPDCPGGRWVSTAAVAEGAAGFRIGPIHIDVGGLVFAGVFLCTSNLSINVPWLTVCSSLSIGPSKGIGKGFGVAPPELGVAGLTCSGAPCIEDLGGEESGGFLQVGPVFGFKEGTPGHGGCIGGGVVTTPGVYAGGFTCRTFLGRPLLF